jgi:hypothetical protein
MLHYPAPIAHASRDATLFDPSSPPPRTMSPSQSTDEIFKTILNVRKCWKTLKGNTEPVWPPYLEATMLKGADHIILITASPHILFPGLHEYKPVDSRETQILGRFPMRNRFISDYIYQHTGKYRSSKQIGSRLQQFRDTSEGRECEYPSPWLRRDGIINDASSRYFWQ